MLSRLMDFNIKKPLHIFALLVLLFALYIIIVYPILSFFGVYPSTQTMEINLQSEFIILISSAIAVLIFVGVPPVWYRFVNEYSLKEMFYSLKLRREGLDSAFLWGVIATFVMLSIVFVIGILLVVIGVDRSNLSNIEDLAAYLSPTSMVFIIIFQSIGEEIFFRGFLLEKIESAAGVNMAVLVTAVLFGLAHMSYGKIYPTIMPIIMGILLGYIVIKTKNLVSAVVAHVLFNFISFILYLFVQSYGFQALIL